MSDEQMSEFPALDPTEVIWESGLIRYSKFIIQVEFGL